MQCSDYGRAVPDPPSAKERRRAAQRAGARRHEASQSRRRPATPKIWFGAGVLTLVLVGAAIATVVATSGTTGSGSAVHVRTLFRARSVSALAEGFGSLWYTNDVANELVKVDPSTGGTLASVHVSGRPTGLVDAFGKLWVSSMVTNTIEEVSASPLRVLRTIPVPAGPTNLAAADGRVWVASLQANSVSGVDPTTGAIATTRVQAGAVRIAAGYGALWVSGLTDQLSRLGLGAGGSITGVTSTRVGSIPLGVVTGDGDVWVAVAGRGSAVAVDPRTLTTVTSVHTGPDPTSVAVDGALVWVADGEANTVTAVQNGRAMGHAALAGSARQVVLTSLGALVAVANPGAVQVASG